MAISNGSHDNNNYNNKKKKNNNNNNNIIIIIIIMMITIHYAWKIVLITTANCVGDDVKRVS